jgi:hypothetical protein
MGKVRSAFVQLKPANNAVIGKILGYPRFRDAQMLRKSWFDGIRTSAARSAAQEIPDGNAQGLTRLDIVIARQIGIGQNKYTGANGRVVSLAKFYGRTGQQPPQLHFEE